MEVEGSGVGVVSGAIGVGVGVAFGVSERSGLWIEAAKGSAEPKLFEKIRKHAIMPTTSTVEASFISYRQLFIKTAIR